MRFLHAFKGFEQSEASLGTSSITPEAMEAATKAGDQFVQTFNSAQRVYEVTAGFQYLLTLSKVAYLPRLMSTNQAQEAMLSDPNKAPGSEIAFFFKALEVIADAIPAVKDTVNNRIAKFGDRPLSQFYYAVNNILYSLKQAEVIEKERNRNIRYVIFYGGGALALVWVSHYLKSKKKVK